ncbi:hypothetical protein SAMN04488040_0676 [Sulfitobacter marinus]|uniref:Cold shock protein, CspA family n=1 Tax=Sulfitobacter marinus TaxID=394264 RepID=A0A1I6QED2_9RHOB|nr:hypothetical protein [Sulfitobacter marinus]SFS50638.1 hypothetical protein SAMN04488040_0676 [Sulfitobacter marinus]
MYGVVLWSDVSDKKAVFWCEDHGDLAYFGGSQDSQNITFDAGDLVEFDVTLKSKLRTASNPRVVREKLDVDLPAKLLGNGPVKRAAQPSAEILPFQSRQHVCSPACGGRIA